MAIMEQEKVTVILCGGCPPHLLNILAMHNFEVKWGLMGDPDDAIKLFIDGKLKNFEELSIKSKSE